MGSPAAGSKVRASQPQQRGAGVTVAAAVAKRDYLNSSFNDSDEF
jgi:hypothetical protein